MTVACLRSMCSKMARWKREQPNKCVLHTAGNKWKNNLKWHKATKKNDSCIHLPQRPVIALIYSSIKTFQCAIGRIRKQGPKICFLRSRNTECILKLSLSNTVSSHWCNYSSTHKDKFYSADFKWMLGSEIRKGCYAIGLSMNYVSTSTHTVNIILPRQR